MNFSSGGALLSLSLIFVLLMPRLASAQPAEGGVEVPDCPGPGCPGTFPEEWAMQEAEVDYRARKETLEEELTKLREEIGEAEPGSEEAQTLRKEAMRIESELEYLEIRASSQIEIF